MGLFDKKYCDSSVHFLLAIVCPDFYALLLIKWTNFDCIRDKINGGSKYVYDQ